MSKIIQKFPAAIFGRLNSCGDRQYFENQSAHLEEVAYIKEHTVCAIVWMLAGALEAQTGEPLAKIFDGLGFEKEFGVAKLMQEKYQRFLDNAKKEK